MLLGPNCSRLAVAITIMDECPLAGAKNSDR